MARFDLTQAEIQRRKGKLAGCRALLNKATQWVVRSGSQEHLCALHLGKARLALDEGRLDAGRTALDEGLHIAEQCGYGFFHALLSITQAQASAGEGDWQGVLRSTTAARLGVRERVDDTSSAAGAGPRLVPGCDHRRARLVWAGARAGLLQGRALVELGRRDEAREALVAVRQLQQSISDPALAETEEALEGL